MEFLLLSLQVCGIVMSMDCKHASSVKLPLESASVIDDGIGKVGPTTLSLLGLLQVEFDIFNPQLGLQLDAVELLMVVDVFICSNCIEFFSFLPHYVTLASALHVILS